MVKIQCDTCGKEGKMEWKNGGWFKPSGFNRITIDHTITKILCNNCNDKYIKKCLNFFDAERK